MRKNDATDFWMRVEKAGDDDCWLYLGSTFNGRYGRFFFEGRSVGAHCVAYELTNGPVPDGLFVLHKCNNKLCCNPRHLCVGTNSENQRHAITSRAFRVGKYGIPGIGFDQKRGYWTASGYEMGKRRNLYTGPSKEKAVEARASWEEKYGIKFSIGESNESI